MWHNTIRVPKVGYLGKVNGKIVMKDSFHITEELTAREREILALIVQGLTNHEIAAQLYITHGTVKWYNRQIYAKLDVNNRAQAILRAQQTKLLEPDSPQAGLAQTNTLPSPSTALIGRRQQIDDLRRLMLDSRLITLTGPGGSGKTRLALELAWLLADSFRQGAILADLAPISEPQQVATAIAQAAEVLENPEEALIETLKRALRHSDLLLVIDNFEHVIGAAPIAAELLAASPQLKILVTSREALRLTGEQEYPVPPLSLPTFDNGALVADDESEAVAFFVQRARMARPDFSLDESNARAIAQICVRLDGLPLALELAAARCKVLTPQALLERLDDRLGTLTGGARDMPARQQTLRRTLEWSHQLLNEHETRLFAQLAIFRGGRSLEAIAAICDEAASTDILETLANLVDKHLIYPKETSTAEPRFWMLETIHEFAWECLENSGEVNTMRQRHAEYFVSLAERAQPELRLARQKYWAQIMGVEHDNLRAVLRASLEEPWLLDYGLRIAGALEPFWFGYGHHVEGYRWTQQLLTGIDDHSSADSRLRLLLSAASMADLRDLAEARQLNLRALELARSLGDEFHAAWAQMMFSYTIMDTNAEATASVEEALAIFRRLKHAPGIAYALNMAGEIARYNGDDDRAKGLYEEALTIAETIGDIRRIAVLKANLALIAQHRNDHAEAIRLFREQLVSYLEMDNRRGLALALTGISGSLSAVGQPERAARLMAAADTTLGRLGAYFEPVDHPDLNSYFARLRASLGEDGFEAAWQAGRQIPLKVAVDDVLQETGD